jgi:hypothetical protein
MQLGHKLAHFGWREAHCKTNGKGRESYLQGFVTNLERQEDREDGDCVVG